MRQTCLLLFLLFSQFLFSQDVIISVDIGDQQKDYFQTAILDMSILKLTACDNYHVDTQIDYFLKTIDFDITYNHSSICPPTLDTIPEAISFLPLLHGNYTVNIELTSPQNSLLDQSIDLGTIEVFNINEFSCTVSFTQPGINCPLVESPVCTCSGINYYNECEAYKSEGAKNYLFDETCIEYMTSRAQDFAIQTYIIDNVDFFNSYDCSDEGYIRDEIFINYSHQEGDTLALYFEPTSIQLFLVQPNNFDDIICIDKSENGQLINTELDGGDYIIVVEEAPATNSVRFLNSPPISNIDEVPLKYNVSSTVIKEHLDISVDTPSKVTAIITDMNGSQLANKTFINQTTLSLGVIPTGMYFLTLYSDQSNVTERIIKM